MIQHSNDPDRDFEVLRIWASNPVFRELHPAPGPVIDPFARPARLPVRGGAAIPGRAVRGLAMRVRRALAAARIEEGRA